jgi:uncharacterized flavoprotein (TIGR03862 family)
MSAQVHVVGSGPAGLAAAESYAKSGAQVIVFDHKKAPARKFLVAGHGGFNLTHSEPIERFVGRYNREEIRGFVCRFTNEDTRTWLRELSIETYVGSSGKVFPVKGIKPVEVLNAWLRRLQELGVEFRFGMKLIDFEPNNLRFQCGNELVEVPAERAVFAFGGQSWSKTGSDGAWVEMFERKGIQLSPLLASNSGLTMSTPFPELEGKPLKNVLVRFAGAEKLGEAVFTAYGIEGSAIYFLNEAIRQHGLPGKLELDLKPDVELEILIRRLQTAKGNIAQRLKALQLDGTKLALLKKLPKESYMELPKLAEHIKSYSIDVNDFRPIDEVISTAGGVSWEELNPDLSLKKFPFIQCVGEMLDWDAPTGGYLLQGCFATGFAAGRGNTNL